MGLKVKDKSRLSTNGLELSFPDKLTQVLRHLRGGDLSHSSSSSAPHTNKSGVVPADDVVYIPTLNLSRLSPHFDEMRRRRHSAVTRPCPLQSPSPVLLRRVRRGHHGLYRSVPNVNVIDQNEYRLKRKSCRGIADEVDAESSRTRSPTDSGYRSTPREPSVENFYSHSEFTPNHILHKTTTVIYVNGGETHSDDYSILKVYGANHSAIDNFALCKDIFQENSQCPFNESDINLLLSKKILQKNGSYFDKSFLPRMTDLLLNTLENIAEHIQRLSINNAKATDDDVTTSAKILFPSKVSYSCIKAANQALALYCTGGSHVLKKSMSQRALLHLSVGKLFYWLMDKLPGKPFSESVPVCITAILEQALEELLLRLCIPGREDITHQKFNEIASTHKSLVSCLASMCKQKEIDSAVVLSQVGLLQSINECRAEDVAQNDEFLQWSKQKQRSLVQMSSSGLQCLRYFIGNKQNSTSKSIGIANWTRIMFAFAEHRMSSTVDDVDVQQAARVLLGCDCAPPLITTNIRECTDLSLADARKEFAFYLAASGSSNHVHNAAVILAGNWTATNQFGLSLLSEAVIRSDTEALRSLIKVGFSVNVPVPNPSDVRRPFLFSDYTGWTPLTWAVAKRNTLCIELLLHSKAQVENDAMIKESPIQVAAQLGDEDVVRQLLSFDANAFRSTMEYRKTSVRSVGSPSALAAACARGHSRIVDIFISRLKDCLSDPQTKLSEIGKIEFKTLPNDIQLALQEAIYYAIETGRLISAVQIWESVPDLPWSAYIWARALQFATERGERKFATRLLTNFSPVMIAKLDAENVEYCTLVLFSHLKWECGHEDGNPSTVASVISSLWNHFNKKPTPNDAAVSSPAFQHRPLVDESFVNNKELSDIRFMVDGEIVYAHRIMLFTASERFKELLRSPSGTVDITDISRSSFLAMLRFIYSRTLPELSVSALCCLYAAGEVYVMPSLCTAILADFVRILNPQNVAFIYQFAIVHNAAFLLRRCEEFLLTKLDVLVTYTKIRDMIKCHSNDYDVCEVLSKKLLSVISSTFKE